MHGWKSQSVNSSERRQSKTRLTSVTSGGDRLFQRDAMCQRHDVLCPRTGARSRENVRTSCENAGVTITTSSPELS